MNFKRIKMMGLALGMGAMLAACGSSDEGETSTQSSGNADDSTLR